jgi:hypothetical protein
MLQQQKKLYNQAKKNSRLSCLIVFVITSFAISAFADTNGVTIPAQDDINIFNADNSDQGVKNNRPVDLSIDEDSLLGVIGDAKVLLGFNNANAAAVELAAGPKVFRGNGTYGFALNDKNRIKITGEYLDENLDFDFYTGDTRQWMSQAAVGAAYQYWIGGGKFKDLQIGGHYSHAGSKNLSDQTIDLGDGISLLDQRRIAGGTDWNGTAEAGLHLWSHSLMNVGADYDKVRYDTHYDIHYDGKDAQGFGGHINLQQLLTSSTQLELHSTVTQLANVYGGGLNWIWTAHNTTAWRAGLESGYTTDHTTGRNFWVNSISLNVVWDQPHEKGSIALYSDPDVSAEDLLTWTATPAVRMPDVLAISDERITTTDSGHHFTPVTATCPEANSITYNASTQTYSSSGGWVQVYPAPGTLSGGALSGFTAAGIMTANSGAVQCEYNVSVTENLLLANPAYTDVQPSGSNWVSGGPPNWPLSQPSPATSCVGNPASCPFETVDPESLISNKMGAANNRLQSSNNRSEKAANWQAFRTTQLT